MTDYCMRGLAAVEASIAIVSIECQRDGVRISLSPESSALGSILPSSA